LIAVRRLPVEMQLNREPSADRYVERRRTRFT